PRSFQNELAMKRQIDDAVVRTRYDVAPCVTERERLRCLERLRIEVAFHRTLAARKGDALTQYDIRPIRSPTVRTVIGEVERIQRRPILDCENPAELPIVHELRKQTTSPVDTRQVVDKCR